MTKCIVSDGITSKEVTFNQFQFETDVRPEETPYPFLMIDGNRFYFNSFLFL